MLPTNAVALNVDALVLVQGVDPLIGPVRAELQADLGKLCLDFLAPISSWTWIKSSFQDDAGRERMLASSDPKIWVYCNQSSQNGEQTWYAFSCEEERNMALTMTEAQGVGMKTVVETLAKCSWKEIQKCIAAGDRAGFKLLPGMKAKTGDKFMELLFKAAPKGSLPPAVLDKGSVAALMALQYKAEVSKKAVSEAQRQLPPGSDTATIVTKALQLLQK